MTDSRCPDLSPTLRPSARGVQQDWLGLAAGGPAGKVRTTTTAVSGMAGTLSLVLVCLAMAGPARVLANDDEAAPKPRVIAPNALRDKAEADKQASRANTPVATQVTTEQLKETIQNSKGRNQSVQLITSDTSKKPAPQAAATAGKPSPAATGAAAGAVQSTSPTIVPAMAQNRSPAPVRSAAPMIQRLEDTPSASQPVVNPRDSRQYIRARAAALAGHEAPASNAGADKAATHGGSHDEVHWAYEGAGGPQAWGKLKPEFNLCALGKRQSPINIEESSTLQGPAEPLQISYRPTNGTVVNNGHTIQVDLDRGNTLTVRGSTYELLQFHFHHPAEERVNYKGFAMVAHLVHKNSEGQLAVLGVLIDPGMASALVHKVWTHMPLESGDRVRLPPELIDLNELLPKDMRYYQFMGSLTTPPCSEGVLWMVLKQPVTASREQIRLFSQLFPNNARPTQALNGRAVREAQ